MLVVCRLAGLSACEAHSATTTTRRNLAQNATGPAHIERERSISFGDRPDPMGSSNETDVEIAHVVSSPRRRDGQPIWPRGKTWRHDFDQPLRLSEPVIHPEGRHASILTVPCTASIREHTYR
jgi:hypothetical protein